jgi:hypothetical protein
MIVAFVLAFWAGAPSEEAWEWRGRLEHARVTMDLRDAWLSDAVDLVAQYAGVPIVFPGELLEALPESQRRVSVRLRDVSARSALRFILQPRGLTVSYREGVISVRRIEDVAAPIVTRIYYVRDLTYSAEDFPAPTLEFGPLDGYGSGTGGGRAQSRLGSPRFLSELYGQTRTASGNEGFPEDRIEELIRTQTGGRSWEEDSRTRIEVLQSGHIVVAQTEEVHAEIGSLLDLLRGSR